MDIVILLFDRFEPLDAIGPYEILAHVPGAKVRFVAPESGRVTDVLGSLPVDVPTRYSDVDACDVLLVPGGGGVRPLLGDQGFLGWLGRVHATTRFTTSVCTGSLLLAAAGLLRGKKAACHWAWRDLLSTFDVLADPARISRDGNVITGGGVTAGIDLALAVTADIAGEAFAQGVQLGLEYAPQPPFECGRPELAPALVVAAARRRLDALGKDRLAAAQRAAQRDLARQ